VSTPEVTAEACPDCHVEPGAAHFEGCDVARCMLTGLQRITCRQCRHGGPDIWTGRERGTDECEEFGWWAYFKPQWGWRECGPDHPGARPDLNRLLVEAVWDPNLKRWTRPASKIEG
jgi:hypothetical protein